MIGRFLTIEYAIIASAVSFVCYIIAMSISKIVTYKIGEANKHSYANNIYKHMNLIISTYLTLFVLLALITIWAGFLVTIVLSMFVISLIIIKYQYGKKAKDFLGILNVIKNNKCDVGEYVQINDAKGKVIKFSNYHLELLDLDGTYLYISGNKIDNIINNSRNVFDVKMEINISIDKNINDVTKILEKELPAITQDYPIILEGPNIDGVSHVDTNYYTLVLSTKLKYEDIDKMKKVINARVVGIIGK